MFDPFLKEVNLGFETCSWFLCWIFASLLWLYEVHSICIAVVQYWIFHYYYLLQFIYHRKPFLMHFILYWESHSWLRLQYGMLLSLKTRRGGYCWFHCNQFQPSCWRMRYSNKFRIQGVNSQVLQFRSVLTPRMALSSCALVATVIPMSTNVKQKPHFLNYSSIEATKWCKMLQNKAGMRCPLASFL